LSVFDSEEPEENLDCQDLLEEFNTRSRAAPSSSSSVLHRSLARNWDGDGDDDPAASGRSGQLELRECTSSRSSWRNERKR
jgi:hypothetical protein